MKEVTCYSSFDGRLFYTKEQCEHHEFEEKVKRVLGVNPSWGWYSLFETIKSEPDKLIELCEIAKMLYPDEMRTIAPD